MAGGSIWAPGTPNVASVSLALAQSAAVAATQSLNIAQIIGTIMYLQGKLVATAVGTAANAIVANLTLSNALSASSVGLPIGTFTYKILGSGVLRSGTVILQSATQLSFQETAQTALLGIAPAVTIAVGDILQFSCIVPLA